MNKLLSLGLGLLLCIFVDTGAIAVASNSDLSHLRLEDQLPIFQPEVNIPANSEWINPIILKKQNEKLYLPKGLDRDLSKYLQKFKTATKLKAGRYLLEIYPVRASGNRWQWYISRYQIASKEQSGWLWSKNVEVVDPWISASEWHKVFGPHRELGLYDKPLYPQCLFSRRERPMTTIRLWDINKDFDAIHAEGKKLQNMWKDIRPVCRLLNAPPVIDGNYKTLQLYLTVSQQGKILWQWQDEYQVIPDSKMNVITIDTKQVVRKWEPEWKEQYHKELQVCAGEKHAEMPDGTLTKFVRKNNLQADHQLGQMLDYLENYYRQLGLKTWRQKFLWQGISQENLIAVIGDEKLPQSPVILVDHYDTAFSEDVWETKKMRVANPGADDNCSATAGLMIAAKQLNISKKSLKKPIWLVHLTGEEFPADDLGARQWVSLMLKEKIEPEAVLVMDMIAYAAKKSDRQLFQISLGSGKKAQLIGAIGQKVSQNLNQFAGHKSKSVIRHRYDDRSFIHQTDGIIFSDYGFPVVLFNEHLNQHDNWERAHYHQSTDHTKTLNIDYALEVLQTATETVRILALDAFQKE